MIFRNSSYCFHSIINCLNVGQGSCQDVGLRFVERLRERGQEERRERRGEAGRRFCRERKEGEEEERRQERREGRKTEHEVERKQLESYNSDSR